MCGLTLELSGPRRWGARPAQCMINKGTARAWWHAVGGPLERRVRQHCFVVGSKAQKRVVRGLRTGLREGGRLVELIQLLRDVFEGATVARRPTARQTSFFISRRLACNGSKNLIDSAHGFVDFGFARTNLMMSDRCMFSCLLLLA